MTFPEPTSKPPKPPKTPRCTGPKPPINDMKLHTGVRVHTVQALKSPHPPSHEACHMERGFGGSKAAEVVHRGKSRSVQLPCLGPYCQAPQWQWSGLTPPPVWCSSRSWTAVAVTVQALLPPCSEGSAKDKGRLLQPHGPLACAPESQPPVRRFVCSAWPPPFRLATSVRQVPCGQKQLGPTESDAGGCSLRRFSCIKT